MNLLVFVANLLKLNETCIIQIYTVQKNIQNNDTEVSLRLQIFS